MGRNLSLPTIVQAALDVLDDGGIDAVTIRAVGSKLGVQGAALYYHVASKQALLDEMGTEISRRVVAALTDRTADGDWLADLSAYAHALRGEYLAHRDGARTFTGTLITDASVRKAQEPWLRRWQADGVTATRSFDGLELVTAFVAGFVIEEQERLQSDPRRYSPADREKRLGAGTPLVVEEGYARHDSASRFDRQLRMVITGVASTPRVDSATVTPGLRE